MLNTDFWKEVVFVIRTQKMRSVLTAFGIFWSMLLLVVLLSCGNGFKNGIFKEMGEIPSQCLYFYSLETAEDGPGIEKNQRWWIDNSDIDNAQMGYGDKIQKVIKRMRYLGPESGYFSANFNDRKYFSLLEGVSAGFEDISRLVIENGRGINQFDCLEKRKVCVIGDRVVNELFESPDDALGQKLSVGGNVFEIIGTCKKANPFFSVGNPAETVFIPFSTGSLIFETGFRCNSIFLLFDEGIDLNSAKARLTSDIKKRHGISPTDRSAVYANTFEHMIDQYSSLYQGLNILLWFVGLGTLLAGLVGVCNIMLITVRERRREIGILRAMGASPSFVISKISCESLVLAFVSGFTGAITGYWLVFLIGRSLRNASNGIFSSPYINPVQLAGALLVLVIGAVVAGIIPAQKALKEKVVNSLRQE